MENKTSIREKLGRGLAVGALALGALTPYSAYSQTQKMQEFFNNAATDAFGTAIREGIKGKLNPDSRETNINVNTGNSLPENVVLRNGEYWPAEGYGWASDNPKDYSVKKIDASRNSGEETYKAFTFLDLKKNGKLDKDFETEQYVFEPERKVTAAISGNNMPNGVKLKMKVLKGDEVIYSAITIANGGNMTYSTVINSEMDIRPYIGEFLEVVWEVNDKEKARHYLQFKR